MAVADTAVLDLVERELLSQEIVELALTRLIEKANEPGEDIDAKRARIDDALKLVDRKLARLKTASIDLDGGELRTLAEAVREIEEDREQLLQQRRDLDAYPAIREAAKHIRVDVLKNLDEWRGLLGKQVGHSRQLASHKPL